MLFSTVSIYLAIALAFVIGLPALWMLQRGLWPESFEKKLAVSKTGVWKSLLIGLVPVIILSIIIAIMGKRLGPVPGLLVSATALAWGFAGAAGMASLIGMRLWPSGEPWQQTRNGGLALVCSALLPMVGWFLLLPLIAVVGVGVNVRAWFWKPKPLLVAPPPVTVVAETP